MTDRHTVNSITSDALDALYDRLDRIRDAAVLHRQGLIRTSELYAVIEADPPRSRARSTEEEPMTDPSREQRIAELDARAHNARAAIPTRDEVSRYDRLSPLARALVDDFDELDLAEMLVAAQNDIASCKAQQWPQRLARAERERDVARQHAAAIAAQRDRLRQRMNTLADRWDAALAPDKPYARTLREEINCAPFDPEGAMTVQEYTERGHRLWAFRCWGTDTCDGWLGLQHDTQTSALAERERHVAEAHTALAPAATEADPFSYEERERTGRNAGLVLPAATEATAWTPPPPGDTREQLPDHLLALIDAPDYLSTACEAAILLAWQMPKHTHRRVELGEHSDRLHSRCRLQNKFTGVVCRCDCHATQKGN